MLRDKLRRTQHHIGVDDSNYKALKLLPLIYVAWADGVIEKVEHDRIVNLAHRYFSVGPGGERLIRNWLSKRPSPEYFHEGMHDILLLARAVDEGEFDLDELPGLLAHAEAIARTTADALDAPTAVSAAEEAALHEIAEELHVDNGVSWAALLKELGN